MLKSGPSRLLLGMPPRIRVSKATAQEDMPPVGLQSWLTPSPLPDHVGSRGQPLTFKMTPPQFPFQTSKRSSWRSCAYDG